MAPKSRVSKITSHLTGAISRGVDYDNNNPNNISFDGHTPNNVRDAWVRRDDNAVLTAEQLKFYEEHGYLVVKNLISKDKIERWRQHFVDLCADPSKRPEGMTVQRDISLAKGGLTKEEANNEKYITKLQDWTDDEVFMEYARDPKVLEIVQAFTGKGIQAMHTMLINKPPDTGVGSSRHPLHQDLLYFPWRPAERTVAAWTAMQEIDEENGCLHVLPGTHITPLLQHGYPDDGVVNKAYHGIQGLPNDMNLLKVKMSAGDTVFFHPLLWHGSGPNFSDRYRKAISVHFAGTETSTYINVTGTIQEDMESEIQEMIFMKLNQRGVQLPKDFKVNLADIWTMRSKVVQGERSIDDLKPKSYVDILNHME